MIEPTESRWLLAGAEGSESLSRLEFKEAELAVEYGPGAARPTRLCTVQ
jgi:hypothetical protein